MAISQNEPRTKERADFLARRKTTKRASTHQNQNWTVEVLPGNVVKVKGPLGELSQKVDVDITVAVEGTEVKLTRPTDQPRHRSLHGLYRALINNMVVGVSQGYTIRQELVGVGSLQCQDGCTEV